MFLIKDIKDNPSKYNLPVEFIALFDSYCETCGSPMGISEGLTEYRCMNNNCKDKLIFRILSIIKHAGIKDITFDEVTKMVDKNKWSNPFEILSHPKTRAFYTGIKRERQRLLVADVLSIKELTVSEYISYSAVISDSNSSNYFAECNTLDDAVKALETLIDDCKIDSEVDISLLKDYYYLLENKEWLEKGLRYTSLKEIKHED